MRKNNIIIKNNTLPHHTGHRSRLRNRFLTSGIDSLADYEILELILFSSNPRGDTKPLAKQLLSQFETVSGVLKADVNELCKIEGLKEAGIANIKLYQEVAHLLLREQAQEKPVIHSWKNVLDYCQASMSHLKNEQFRLLFLDRKNRIIKDEVQQVGTIDQTPVYPREVAKRALELGASSLIMVHNHPSGDPTPSMADISITQKVQAAIEALNITLHDHIIVGKGRHVSLRAEGHIL